MRIGLARCVLRPFRESDQEALIRKANNPKIGAALRDGFPHPYTVEAARAFLDKAAAPPPPYILCIEVGGQAAGAIGAHPHADVERFSAEVGYWLAEEFWGRGIMTEALAATTRWALDECGLHRLFATPYAWNKASCRVLEKAGYTLEGHLRQHSFKAGQFVDQVLYGFVAGDQTPHIGKID